MILRNVLFLIAFLSVVGCCKKNPEPRKQVDFYMMKSSSDHEMIAAMYHELGFGNNNSVVSILAVEPWSHRFMVKVERPVAVKP